MVAKNKLLKRLAVLVAVSAASLFVALVFVSPQSANAAVGTGAASAGGVSGCVSGGRAGCPWTTNGQGWYQLALNDPNAPRGNGYWDVANATCSAEGATHVIAYVVLTGERTLPKGWIYKYKWGWEGGGPYRGNISRDDAWNKFNAVPDKGAYTFGVDVGWFCYTDRTQWSINAQSYIQVGAATGTGLSQGTINARPGDRLNWYHDMRNVGPQAMDRDIYYNVDKTGFSNGWNSNKDPRGYARGGVWSLFVTAYATNGAPYTLYDVTQADVGNTLCQRIAWNPANWNNPGWAASNDACAYIPYQYSLTPTISNITDGGIVESLAGPLTVDGTVTNNGPTKSRTNVNWQITQIKYSPGASIPNRTGGPSGNNPCGFFTGGACDAVDSGVEAAGYSFPGSRPYTAGATIGEEEVGTRICYAMSVQPYTSANNNWMHSQLYCLTVNKLPKVQLLGGDLVTGRTSAYNAGEISQVITSVSRTAAAGYFGSWSEYGIIASGTVSGMASGSAYVGGSTDPDLCRLSLLTIPNSGTGTCNSSTLGGYTHSTTSPNVASQFPVSSGTSAITNSSVDLDNLQGVYQTARTTLAVRGGSPLTDGRWVVINAPGATVTISDNIQYTTAPLTSVEDIPQVIIIARNILIADNVSNVDAWLIATGTGGQGNINTCGAGAVGQSTTLRADICDTPLTINGPVMANHLLLRRTAGAGVGVASGNPAEVINLRADAYVWATEYNSGSLRLPTIKVVELPPRF